MEKDEVLPFEALTGIENPLTAALVLFACILSVTWVLDLYGIIDVRRMLGMNRGGDGIDGEDCGE